MWDAMFADTGPEPTHTYTHTRTHTYTHTHTRTNTCTQILDRRTLCNLLTPVPHLSVCICVLDSNGHGEHYDAID
jgi:carbohydrate-binding DOMON domain-containing protein